MKRIFIAFLISLVGLILSWLLLRPEEWGVLHDQNRQVVGKIVHTISDVNRQTEGRLLWIPVRQGDEIFLGDKIKTSGLSSAVIEFINSKSKLEIEENSTIKMEGEGKKLALNMLEGRVFLKQDETKNGGEVDLISGGKKLEVQGSAAISLNKDGTSQVDSFKQENQENPFFDLTPGYGEDLFTTKNKIELTWRTLLKKGEVFLQTGTSPSLLTKNQSLSNISKGKLLIEFSPGVNYWRLYTIIGGTEVYSPLMRFTLTTPIAPSPLSPGPSEILNLKVKKFDFKWIKGNFGDDVVIEVSKDPKFLNMIENVTIKGQTFYTSEKIYDQGDYYWRIKSRPDQKSEWIESKMINFKILPADNLISPTPMKPLDGSIFYLSENDSVKVIFEWKQQMTAKGYELIIEDKIEKKRIQKSETTAEVKLKNAGKYTWYIESESEDGLKSTFPIRRSLEIRKMDKLRWNMNSKVFYYLDTYPILILEWIRSTQTSFLLRISSKSDMSDSEIFQVNGKDFPYRPMKDGFHYAKIFSLDEKGQISGESDVFEFRVEKAPLPPIVELNEDNLLASSRGELSTGVLNFKEGWIVQARIINSKGIVVDDRNFSNSQILFRGLLPGVYKLQLNYLDQYQRKGAETSSAKVLVPEKSLIAAPKIKGIKIR